MPQQAGRVIAQLLDSAGLSVPLLQQKAVTIWSQVVGKPIASHTTAVEVKHGALIVRASTPVWRNELVLQKGQILEKLNKALGRRAIRDIRFQ